MLETITLENRMIIVKTSNNEDFSDILEYINNKKRQAALDDLLKFSKENVVIENGYKFNRDECYDR